MTSGNKHNTHLSKVVGYSFPFFLTILFLYLAFKNIDLKQTFEIILNSSIPAILFYVFIFFLSHMARAIRWKYMIKPIKENCSTSHLFGAVMVGYGVSCLIPRLGELYRGLFLGRWEGISRSTVIGTIVIERIIDIALFGIAALISVSLYSGNMYNEIVWLKASLLIGLIFTLAATIFLVLLIRFQKNFSSALVRLAERINKKYADKLKEIFETLVEGLSSIRKTGNVLAILLWSVVILLLYAFHAQVGFYIVGMQSTGKINFELAWIVMTISSFGSIIPTPGALGSYHIISIFVLTKLFGFDYESSAAYAIITHFISYVTFILSTVVIVYFVNRSRQRKGLAKETFLSVFKINPEEK